MKFVAPILILSAMLLSFSAANAQEPTDDIRMAAGLRARGLFQLAESYCQTRLADTEINPTEQATLVLELMRSQSARAVVSTDKQRESAWQYSNETARAFLDRHPNHPRAFLIQVQQALNFLARGRLIQQELAAEMVDSSAAESALGHLRTANSQLNELARLIDKAIPLQRTRSLNEHELSADQLMSLRNNIRYQLAACNLSRAKLFPADDQLNRIDALTQVIRRLDEVRGQSSPEQPIWWQTQLARMQAHRLLGETTDAQQILLDLPVEEADGDMRQAILQESIKLSISVGDFSKANQQFELANQFKPQQPQTSLAVLQLLLKLSEGPGGGKWLARAAKTTSQIEVNHGAYWGRRAELMLISKGGSSGSTTSVPNGSGSTEMSILTRVGDDAVRKGQLADALKAYNKALELARASGSGQQELLLCVKSSGVFETQKQYSMAAERLTQVAEKHAAMEGSAKIHLRGCWNAAQAIRIEKNKATIKQLEAQFVSRLTNHLKSWPDSETRNRASLWRGQQFHREQNWKPAITDYLSIDANSPYLAESVVNARRCIQGLLAEKKKSNQLSGSYETDLLKQLRQMLSTSEQTPTNAKFELAITLTDFVVQLPSVPSGLHFELLQKLLALHTSAPNELKGRLASRAAVLQANVALSKNRADEETEVMGELASQIQDASQLKHTASQLRLLAQRQTNSQQKKLVAKMRETFVKRAEQINMSDAERIFWTEESAQVLVALDRKDEAIARLKKLAEQKPNSANAQLALARALPDDEALLAWRRVVRKLKPRSDNWFEAKYHVALILNRTGKSADALKLLEFMRIGKGWSKSSWKPQLDQLYLDCQN